MKFFLFLFCVSWKLIFSVEINENFNVQESCEIGEAFSMQFDPTEIFLGDLGDEFKFSELSLGNFEKENSKFERFKTISEYYGKFIRKGSKIYNYFKTDEYKYYLEIIDISEPNNPIKRKFETYFLDEITTDIISMAVYQENLQEYLYVAFGTLGKVYGFNVTDPKNILNGKKILENEEDQVTGIHFLKVNGNELHVCFYGSQFLHISKKSFSQKYNLLGRALDPQLLNSSILFENKKTTDIVFIESEVVLISFVEYEEIGEFVIKKNIGGFNIYNTSENSIIQLINSYDNNYYDIKGIERVLYQENILYAIEYTSITTIFKISIFDISNYLNIRKLGEIEIEATFMDFVLEDIYLYVTIIDQIVIIDVSDPQNPTIKETQEGKDYFNQFYQILPLSFEEEKFVISSPEDDLTMFEYKAITISGPCEVGIQEIVFEGCSLYNDSRKINKNDCVNTTFQIIGKCNNLDCKTGLPTADCSKCQCANEEYFGKECDTWRCGDYLNSNKFFVCGGIGSCIAPEICQCGNISSSENWKYDNLCNKVCLEGMTMIDGNCYNVALTTGIIISISGIFGFIVILCIVAAAFSVFFYFKFKKTENKINEIDDIDIILQEQKLAKDSTVPKFNINKKMFEIDVKDIKIQDKIGEGGGSAVIYSAEWNKKKVAYKCFIIQDFLGNKKFAEFEKEVELLASLSFPSILTFYGATLNSQRVGFVMEFAENGDLEHFLKKYKKENNGKSYPTKKKMKMLYDISSALLYLHNKNIIHRDLKPQNVLVTKNEDIKVMDFGFSKFSDNRNDQTMTKKVGTSFYMAPEVMDGKYSFSCDAYSFAMLMFVVLSENYSPFGKNAFFISNEIVNNPSLRPDIKELEILSIEKQVQEMIITNWNQDNKKRMKFDEITKFFEDLQGKNANVEKKKNAEENPNLKAENEKLKKENQKLKEIIRSLEEKIKH